ncbi:hypothetical protein BFW01_g12640 [Lasiodiplodia theobromae]|uniref:Uncharacterized protein n=1 Tax=Lasiodiplodia theobromae TaxID=45133 RepID=A0A5N5DQR6_9PEZI|nr:uncharacterized protein LTHEOB_7445 [Lasiodiplodia theobromae]KAB2580255.1 hypothetical protein DBV05_g1300 [Lasiodiplodia theobromae]KAF4542715.1 hypothetical protein LTHEOB_7445 [Lasiodiplodia theobromae]KAF9640834.1 hypothetical protein BFW01_g12640 [Lasiodiplodia theobromae]
MSTPAHTVLYTSELLELILQHLDTRTLLTSVTRVSRRWRDTAYLSLPLRRHALFLESVPDSARGALLPLNPPGETTANRIKPGDALPRELQPVVNEFLLRTFRLGRYDEPDIDHDGGYMPMVAVKGLEQLAEAEEERRRRGSGGAAVVAAAAEAAAAGEEKKRNDEGNAQCATAAITGEPTWRRMLIIQPPPRRVEIVIYGSDMFQSVKAWVECQEGVTLGVLYDKCQEMVHGRGWRKRSMGWFFEL